MPHWGMQPVVAGLSIRGLLRLVCVDLLVRPFRFGLEDSAVLDALDSSEGFVCVEEARCRPAQRHLGVSKTGDPTARAAHDADVVSDDVGRAQALHQRGRQAQGIDGEGLVQAFEQRRRRFRMPTTAPAAPGTVDPSSTQAAKRVLHNPRSAPRGSSRRASRQGPRTS